MLYPTELQPPCFDGRLVGLEPTTTWSKTMYSKPAVNPCIKDPTKVSRELSYETIVRIRRNALRTVDRPPYLIETPASRRDSGVIH